MNVENLGNPYLNEGVSQSFQTFDQFRLDKMTIDLIINAKTIAKLTQLKSDTKSKRSHRTIKLNNSDFNPYSHNHIDDYYFNYEANSIDFNVRVASINSERTEYSHKHM